MFDFKNRLRYLRNKEEILLEKKRLDGEFRELGLEIRDESLFDVKSFAFFFYFYFFFKNEKKYELTIAYDYSSKKMNCFFSENKPLSPSVFLGFAVYDTDIEKKKKSVNFHEDFNSLDEFKKFINENKKK